MVSEAHTNREAIDIVPYYDIEIDHHAGARGSHVRRPLGGWTRNWPMVIHCRYLYSRVKDVWPIKRSCDATCHEYRSARITCSGMLQLLQHSAAHNYTCILSDFYFDRSSSTFTAWIIQCEQWDERQRSVHRHANCRQLLNTELKQLFCCYMHQMYSE